MTDAQLEEMFTRILSHLPKNGRANHLPIVTAILIAIGPTLAGTAAWLQARSTHVAVNSRMDAALEAATEKGNREGRTEQRMETAVAGGVRPQDASLARELMDFLKKYEGK